MAITNVKSNFSAYTLDDFDETKNYQRILFKPGFAVQARELTQLQTALQAQIDKLGQYAFKDGARVINGHATLNVDFDYIKLESSYNTANVANPELFLGAEIVGLTNGVTATVLHVEQQATTATGTDPITLYVKYTTAGGADKSIQKFIAGEEIRGSVSVGGSNVDKFAKIGGDTTPEFNSTILNPVGFGSAIYISEGVYFISGNFVHVPASTLILDKYTNTPNYIVGLEVLESVVSASDADHVNLADNASGSTNASAPGADRYIISTTLIKQSTIDASDGSYDPAGLVARATSDGIDNYVHLLSVKDGTVLNVSSGTDPSTELNEKLEARTFDESGDYTVSPFILDIKQDKNENGNFGHDVNGDQNKVYVGIEAGTAYIDGRRIEKSQSDEVRLNKPRVNNTETTSEVSIPVGYGNYVELDPATVKGLPDITNLSNIQLKTNSSSIGFARARDIQYDSTNNVFRLHLFDILMTSSSFAAVTKVSQGSTFTATLSTAGKLFETSDNNLIYKLPANAVQSLMSGGNSPASTVDLTLRVLVSSGASTVSNEAITGISLPENTTLASEADAMAYAGTPGTDSWVTYNLGAGNFTGTTQVGAGSINLETLPSDFNGKSISVICTVDRLDSGHNTKVYHPAATHTITVSGSSTTGLLGVHDGIKLISVVRTGGNDNRDGLDYTDRFTLDGGQRDNYYQEAKVKIIPGGLIVPDGNYIVTFSHFAHGAAGNYFSVDSYSHEDTVTDVYGLIPTYNGTSLRDALDFRPSKSIGVTADGGDFTSSSPVLPQSGIIAATGAAQASITFYKGRIDKLFLTKGGEFKVVEGTTGKFPVPPENIENAIHLYTFNLKPYVFDLSDVQVIPVDNKRYTMRDIAKIDKRVKNLEYYTSLSLLERSAAQAEITDAAGVVRFKNGFIVDGFKGHNVGNSANPDYAAAVDKQNGLLRPKFDERSLNLIKKAGIESTASTLAARNVANIAANVCTTAERGGVVTLPYTQAVELDQPYASYAEFVNPYNVIVWDGTVRLSPDSDEWKEVDQRPDLIINDNSQYDQFVAMAEETGILGLSWNEWETNWTGEEVTVSSTSSTSMSSSNARALTGQTVATDGSTSGSLAVVSTTTQGIKTTDNQSRSGVETSIGSSTVTKTVGNFVVETSYIPFMRSRRVYFDAQLLKPDTKMYAFFDGTDITAYCKQHKAGTNHVNSDFVEFSDRTGVKEYKDATTHPDSGSGTLTTDATGRLIGSMVIPNNSDFRFKTGTRQFKLTDRSDNNDELASTTAIESYHAQGILEVKQRTIINTKVGRLVHREVSQNRTLTSSRLEVQHDLVRYYDPIAESFVISTQGGIFTTSMELFFNQIDSAIPICVSIREVENGTPTQRIVPGAEKVLYPADIAAQKAAALSDGTTASNFANADATHGTYIDWDHPVYLQEGKEYAVVCISNSDKYKVYVAETSKFDISNGDYRITKQPFNGVFFTSANASTWSPEQNKDLKFKLNRASFSTNECTLTMVNDSIQADLLPTNPFTFISETPANSKCKIRVRHPNHGMYGATNGGSLHKVTIDTGLPLTIDDPSNPGTDIDNTINSVAVSLINGTHDVVDATLDSYVIEVGSAVLAGNPQFLNISGGGTAVTATKNRPYDLFKLNTASIEFGDISIKYGLKGRTARSQDGLSSLTPYTAEPATGYKTILANKNEEMDSPMLIASDVNANSKITAGAKSFEIQCKFNNNGVENLSPVLDLNRTSVITVTNRINDATGNSSEYQNNIGDYTADTESENTSNAAKYITRTVELDTPADELDIYASINRPRHSNIDLFYKVADDDGAIDDNDWTLLAPTNAIPENDGGIYTEIHYSKNFELESTPLTFNKFIIKIVLRSKDSTKIPTVKDFRAVAST